jgi:hypothetical protein
VNWEAISAIGQLVGALAVAAPQPLRHDGEGKGKTISVIRGFSKKKGGKSRHSFATTYNRQGAICEKANQPVR